MLLILSSYTLCQHQAQAPALMPHFCLNLAECLHVCNAEEMARAMDTTVLATLEAHHALLQNANHMSVHMSVRWLLAKPL